METIQSNTLQKFRHWKYEKEWRIVIIEGAGTNHIFNPSSLTGIILGSRIDDEMRGKLRSTLKMRAQLGMSPIRAYTAQLRESKYRILICGGDI